MDNLLSFWRHICRHKYLVTLLIFGVIIIFLDENSLLRRLELYHEANELRSEIEKYREDVENSTRRLNELAADSGTIEQVARERYFMKKPNEDIYVFEEDIEDLE